MRPRDVRTEKELLALRSDNKSTPEGWILIDGVKVVISAQRNGEPSSGVVSLPMGEFSRMVDWYNRDQKGTD